MAGKIPFILGLGAGYVLGTRAGRAQYERIKTAASKVAEQPFVRTRVDAASSHVKQAVRAQGEAVTEKVADVSCPSTCRCAPGWRRRSRWPA